MLVVSSEYISSSVRKGSRDHVTGMQWVLCGLDKLNAAGKTGDLAMS